MLSGTVKTTSPDPRKDGEHQTVLLTPGVIEVLERRKKAAQSSKSPFVFPGSGETGHLVEPRAA